MLPLLDVRHLSVEFPTRGSAAQPLTAVRDLSLTIAPREVLGLVGESGSRKSVTSLAVMRLLPPQARVAGVIPVRRKGLEPRQTLAQCIPFVGYSSDESRTCC